jgi:broad specificity phosphatase PhoE
MLRIALIQPGATDFDDQGRIKGSLDIPLSVNGKSQVRRTVEELATLEIDAIYTAPGQSALQTATALAAAHRARIKRVKELRNLDHGLWHGKLIEEVKQKQPKIYRQCQDYPQWICPPEGESVAAAQRRVRAAVAKIIRKHKTGTVALVVPEPVASLVRHQLQNSAWGDFWKAERDSGGWTLINIDPELAVGGERVVVTAGGIGERQPREDTR